MLGVTESRVCQIHTKAILQLRGRLIEPPSERPSSDASPRHAASRADRLASHVGARLARSHSSGRFLGTSSIASLPAALARPGGLRWSPAPSAPRPRALVALVVASAAVVVRRRATRPRTRRRPGPGRSPAASSARSSRRRSRYGAGHRGADLAAAPGTPVLAAGAGRVDVRGTGRRHAARRRRARRRAEDVGRRSSPRSRCAAGQTVAPATVVGTAGGIGPEHAVGVVHFALRVRGRVRGPDAAVRRGRPHEGGAPGAAAPSTGATRARPAGGRGARPRAVAPPPAAHPRPRAGRRSPASGTARPARWATRSPARSTVGRVPRPAARRSRGGRSRRRRRSAPRSRTCAAWRRGFVAYVRSRADCTSRRRRAGAGRRRLGPPPLRGRWDQQPHRPAHRRHVRARHATRSATTPTRSGGSRTGAGGGPYRARRHLDRSRRAGAPAARPAARVRRARTRAARSISSRTRRAASSSTRSSSSPTTRPTRRCRRSAPSSRSRRRTRARRSPRSRPTSARRRPAARCSTASSDLAGGAIPPSGGTSTRQLDPRSPLMRRLRAPRPARPDRPHVDRPAIDDVVVPRDQHRPSAARARSPRTRRARRPLGRSCATAQAMTAARLALEQRPPACVGWVEGVRGAVEPVLIRGSSSPSAAAVGRACSTRRSLPVARSPSP